MVKATDLYNKAVALSEKFDEHFLELAKTLRTLRDVDLKKFRDCVQNSGIGLRKAYYMVEIDKTFEHLNVLPSRLRNIGWTKLMLIAKQINKQNAKQLLKWAEDNTAMDLKQLIKGEKPEGNAHCIMLYFSEKDYAEFAKVLQQHGGEISGRTIANKEQALMNVIKLAKNLPKAPAKAK